MRHRVRYFVDEAVIGSAAFVEDMVREANDRCAERRKCGPRKIRGCVIELRA